jgi:hypothetical protein
MDVFTKKILNGGVFGITFYVTQVNDDDDDDATWDHLLGDDCRLLELCTINHSRASFGNSSSL